MRAFSQRPWKFGATAIAVIFALGTPAAANDGDAIGKLLAEQFGKERGANLPTGAARKVVPAQAPAASDEQRLIDEIEMLERARAEAEARRDALVKAREATEQEESRATESAERARHEQQLAEQRRAAEEAERAVEAARKAEAAAVARMEAEREAEANRVDEALRKAREARAQRAREDIGRNARWQEPQSDQRHEEGREEPVRRDRPTVADRSAPWDRPYHPQGPFGLRGPAPEAVGTSTRVTVLLSMMPGHHGIRRHHRTGDPILCGEPGCFVSAGADAPADLMPLRRAFGFGRTMGERAGACSNSLGCVFRDVELGAFPAILQPVDMRLLKHDRRMPQMLHETSECRLSGGRLSCTAIHGPDYTMWVVPEDVARAAGPEVLERAVEEGLDGPEPRVFVRN